MIRLLTLTAIGLLLLPSAVSAQEDVVATFSIVAIDPDSGAMGCAVQSRYLAEAERAVALWPDGPNTHLNLGLLAYSAGDKETALAELMRAAALNPYFCEQLKATIMWTEHDGLEESFMKKLCH